MAAELRFIPSRVEGLPGVTEVAVFPDRIELKSANRLVTHRFVDIARWPRPRLMWRLLSRLGLRPKWLPVGDRDWFHEPADMFVEFYTDPPLKVFMPRDEVKDPYHASHFVRLQQVLGEGGFHTFDLG
jgi:hypothetical protein